MAVGLGDGRDGRRLLFWWENSGEFMLGALARECEPEYDIDPFRKPVGGGGLRRVEGIGAERVEGLTDRVAIGYYLRLPCKRHQNELIDNRE
jgi:hypothetical protein